MKRLIPLIATAIFLAIEIPLMVWLARDVQRAQRP
jgi:hypothetical protein